jgi:hypothetical protein
VLRRGLTQRTAQLGGIDVTAGGLTIQRRDVRDAALDDFVGHRSHPLGRVLEVYWSQSFTW